MGNTADWFARKLGSAPAPPAPASYTPATAPQGPAQPGSRLAPPQPPQLTPEQLAELDQLDPSQLTEALLPSMEDKHRQLMARIAQAPLRTQGMAARTEQDRCPSCGGGNYFSRRNGMSRGPAPAPHCWDCGYPNVQFGSEMGAGAGAQVTGSGHAGQVG